MEQQRQHKEIKMEIRLRFKRNCFYKAPQEQGTEIQYNIQHARQQPELLGKHVHGNTSQYNILSTLPLRTGEMPKTSYVEHYNKYTQS